MTLPPDPPVALALSAMNIPYRLFRHPGPIHSLEQAARERGQHPEQVVRSIVFRLAEGNYAMVLVAGPEQVSWRALRAHMGQSRLTMASQKEVFQATGYQLGAVAPFGLPASMPILVDKSVLAQEEISIGSGERGTTIILRRDVLMQALGDVPIGDFRQDTEE